MFGSLDSGIIFSRKIYPLKRQALIPFVGKARQVNKNSFYHAKLDLKAGIAHGSLLGSLCFAIYVDDSRKAYTVNPVCSTNLTKLAE